MKTSVRTAVLLFVSATLVAACSSTPDEKYPDVKSFCGAKAKAECAGVANTCGVSVTTCEGARASACVTFAAANVSPTRTYKPANAEACLTAVTAAYADQRLTVAEEDVTVSGSMGERCARVFEGKGAKGDACTSSFDCTGAFICAKAQTARATLVCATKAPKALGDGCANAGDTCAAGSFCDTAGTVTCAASKKKGEACSTADPSGAGDLYVPCAEALRCDAQLCADRVGVGAACASHADCASDVPYCYESAAGKRCAPSLIFSPEATVCKDYGKI